MEAALAPLSHGTAVCSIVSNFVSISRFGRFAIAECQVGGFGPVTVHLEISEMARQLLRHKWYRLTTEK